MQNDDFVLFAWVGAIAMGVLSALFTLVWRALKTRWALYFAVSYFFLSLLYAFDKYTRPAVDRPNMTSALAALVTTLLFTFGMVEFVELRGRATALIKRATLAVATLGYLLAALQLISRLFGFGILALLYCLQACLAVWALRKEPRHGHGLVVCALMSYPAVFVAASLHWIPAAALRYSFILPVGINGMMLLTTGLLRAQKRSDQAELSLRALNESLEQRVEQRTAQLQDAVARLDQVNEKLSALNASRARLMASACHDLRQPAHALGLLAEAAAKQATPELRQPIETIRRASAALSDMLDMLLELTQLEEDRYRPLVADLSLNELLDELRVQFEPLAHRKGLAFTVEPAPVAVHSDRHLLRRILLNLVSNGIKYTSRGSVHLRAWAKEGEVTIEVADTGPGIPEDQAELVFADFVRLDATRHVEGLGIGLPIVKRAADLLGHKVWLHSEVGRGTSFFVRLPQAAHAPVPASTLPEVDGANHLIGVLENDESILAATRELLAVHGFRVAVGRDLDELRRALSAQGWPAPELMISDLHLTEGLDGLQVVQSLRHEGDWAATKYVLMTGDLDADIACKAAALGVALAYKPVQPRRLLALLDQLLRPAADPHRDRVAGEAARLSTP